MKITYDKYANAAYIYLKTIITPGEVKYTYSCDPAEINGQVNLDFNALGQLIGIEILDANHKLPQELLSFLKIQKGGKCRRSLKT